MGSVIGARRTVNGAEMVAGIMAEEVGRLRAGIERRINAGLVAAVEQLLGRKPYERRAGVASWEEQAGACAKCGSHMVRRFSRNGYRERQLLSEWGELALELPRVRCECGGSVQLALGGLLAPYQRISTTVDVQIQRWGQLALSLREMQAELAHTFIGVLGRQTLVKRLQALTTAPPIEGELSMVPPVVQVDAIWISQLRPNGQFRTDAKRRRRPVKARVKRPLFLAIGLWPESGQCLLLAWHLGESESADEWITFLERLEAAGLRAEAGLELLIHDGGSGLCAALEVVHFGVPLQRCLFHKLRNIAHAIVLPDGLSRPEQRRQRRTILKEFQAIWTAKHAATALRRYRKLVRRFSTSQPAAVATLRRDFRATLTFYHLERPHPTWPRSALRTTSRLERFNRRLRRRARAAGAYHSDASILAMVSQEANALH